MNAQRRIPPSNRGTTLVFVLITVTVLSFIAADVCLKSVQRYRYTMQSASWDESLGVSEAGAERAMAALNTNSWTGWKDSSGNTPTGAPSTSGTYTLAVTLRHTFPGENSRDAAMVVTLDAPSGMSNSYGQWYRIRSVGVVGLPRAGAIGQEETLLDSKGNKIGHVKMLRKFSFTNDASAGLVPLPQVSRTVEALAMPGNHPFVRALTLQSSIQMSGGGIIDSFDSSDPTKSTNGLYDFSKRQSNGNIGSLNSNGSDLRSTYVYGSLAYTGTEPANDSNVQGGVTSPFSTTITPVKNPTWTANSPITVINSTTTITAGTQSSPTRVKVSSLTVPGGKSLTLAALPSGAESYIEIWVTGDFTTSGSGYIVEQQHVHATYYIDGNITVSGSSFNNQSGLAANNQIYGVGGTNSTITVSGGGNFIGAVNAPNYNVTISGAANFSGAFVVNTLLISGGASLHYDQSLSSALGAGTYTVGSWTEVYQ